ncbi:Protein of unknown function DUF177 [Lachnospiraceae bacterium TWA4]|nr:Protein of unknown function DUF177 [Lachnospiraceae bacterium TWA4]
MLIHLSDILLTVGKEYMIEVPFEAEEVLWNGVNYPVLEKKPFVGKVRNEGNQRFHVELEGSLRLKFVCDRCLEEVPMDFSLQIVEDIDKKEEAELEFYVEGDQLNAEELILQELLLHMPMKVLCNENCKGICNRCGANLNRGTCSCKEEPKDMRMAAILDIFNAATKD